jgi:hypothetical protein
VKTSEVVRAWACILSGGTPSLSIELTRECPLRCPGCYAYEDAHLEAYRVSTAVSFRTTKATPWCNARSV